MYAPGLGSITECPQCSSAVSLTMVHRAWTQHGGVGGESAAWATLLLGGRLPLMGPGVPGCPSSQGHFSSTVV